MKKNKGWLNVLMLVVLCVCISAGSIAVYDRYFATKVVAFRLGAFKEKIKEDFISGQLTEQQLDAELKRFEEMMLAQPKNTVVLVSNAFVSKNIEMIEY